MHSEINQEDLHQACHILEKVASDIGCAEAIASIRIRSEDDGGGVDVFLNVEPSVSSYVNLSPRFEILDHHDLSVTEQLLKQVETTAKTWQLLADALTKALNSSRATRKIRTEMQNGQTEDLPAFLIFKKRPG